MPDLGQLLSDAAPAPLRVPQADRLWERGRRRRRRQQAVSGAAGLAMLAVLAVTFRGLLPAPPSVALASGSGAAPAGEDLHVLSQPATPQDALPGWLAGSWIAAELAQPIEARLAARQGDTAYYVARGPDGTVCLVQAKADTQTATGTCGPVELLRNEGVIWLEVVNDAERTLAGVVPNGYALATTDGGEFPITDNVFVFSPVPTIATTVTLAGANGERHLQIRADLDPGESEPGELQPGSVPPAGGFVPVEDDGDPLAPDQPMSECSALVGMAPLEAEAALRERGYHLSWRYEYSTGSNTGYAEARSSPPLGVVTGAAAGMDGEVIVFVSPADEAARPMGEEC